MRKVGVITNQHQVAELNNNFFDAILVLKLDWCTMFSKVYVFFYSCGHLH